MEASTLTVTPLYGAHSADPPCYLLEIDDFTILLDAGWTEAFDVALLEPLRTVAPRVDIVLISHCDVEHLGALAYAMKHFELRAPVYATLPVSKMGQMFMYDAYENAARHATEPFELFDLDDVDRAFKRFIELKYSQVVKLGGKGSGIAIRPVAAGHMIGGAIWHITKVRVRVRVLTRTLRLGLGTPKPSPDPDLNPNPNATPDPDPDPDPSPKPEPEPEPEPEP